MVLGATPHKREIMLESFRCQKISKRLNKGMHVPIFRSTIYCDLKNTDTYIFENHLNRVLGTMIGAHFI